MKPLLAGFVMAGALLGMAAAAEAQNKGTAGGAAAGAATGAVVAGPVGAVVGGVAGATIGHETVDKKDTASVRHRKARHHAKRNAPSQTTTSTGPAG